MDEQHQKQANQLIIALELSLPPVAIALCEVVPNDIPAFDGVVPAGCTFWQEAATRTFTTLAKDHALCSIGIHTHNMQEAPSSQPVELHASLQAMVGLDYVRKEEVAAIPVVQRTVKHAVYGPLADFPMAPEVIFLFVHAHQGLILSEAVERVDRGVAPAMGRPACAVVPEVMNRGRAAMSLGCCGARAYLDALSDGVALWALPGSKLDQYCEQIMTFSRANKTLRAFHERRKKDVASGGRPTVEESLQRISS